MPRVSRKKRVLRILDSTLHALQILNFIFDDGDDPYIEDLSTINSKLQKKRYWILRKNPNILMNNLPRWFDTLYNRHNGRKFRSLFRMLSEHFNGLCRLIENHPIFQNNLRNPQVHPCYQLAILLYQLGNPGGVSHEDTSTLLGLGEGTVLLYSNRPLEVLDSLREQFISWPTVDQRNATKIRISKQSLRIFDDAVGFLDGTYITLKYTPQHGYYYYFNRKYTYALNATVICDDR